MAKNANNNGKVIAQNSFEGGLVADLHEMSSPSNTTKDALNMELITTGSDQYIYQNIRGNKKIVDIGSDYEKDGSKYPFIPLGVKVHNGIAYILSGAFEDNGNFLVGAIGTFPSPDWTKVNAGDTTNLESVYRHLHNFSTDGDSPYIEPFISEEFNLDKNRYIDIEIQGDFDRSVNIIFTDAKNVVRMINSRFKRVGNTDVVTLADRLGNKDSNTYSDNDWDRIALLQSSSHDVDVEDYKVRTGGYLRGGGYRYYLTYVTQEGNTTGIFYSTNLIPIANGNLGLSKDQISDKEIEFKVTNLDSSYAGIKVMFAHFDGTGSDPEFDLFEIDRIFTFGIDDDYINIKHTGLENVSEIDETAINSPFSPIDTVQSIAIINDRMAFGGISSTLDEDDIKTLQDAAHSVTLWERTKVLTDDNGDYLDYSDPNAASKELGYWHGEVYEFGIVFILRKNGLSPVFPTLGRDNYYASQSTVNQYPPFGSSYDDDGFLSSPNLGYGDLPNNKGLFRTSNKGDIYEPTCSGPGKRYVKYIFADTSNMISRTNIDDVATGFFIVRRRRLKNVLMQGMMVPTLRVPASIPTKPIASEISRYGNSLVRRYLSIYYKGSNATPYVGLNRAVFGIGEGNPPNYNDYQVEDGFDMVFIPQPSQLISVLTPDRAWLVPGSIGQNEFNNGQIAFGQGVEKVGTDYNDKDVESTGHMHIAFMSPDLDLNSLMIQESLSGIDPEVEVQRTPYQCSPIAMAEKVLKRVTESEYEGNDIDTLVIKQLEKISMDRHSWTTVNSKHIKATIVGSGSSSYTDNTFTGKIQSVWGFHSTATTYTGSYIAPYWSFTEKSSIDNRFIYVAGTSKSFNNVGDNYDRQKSGSGDTRPYRPYSIMSQSQSVYLGIDIEYEVDNEYTELPIFYFNTYNEGSPHYFDNRPPDSILNSIPTNCSVSPKTYVNTGHLANVFRSSVGRWTSNDIKTIYASDSGNPYFSITKRYSIWENKDTNSPLKGVDVFGGDGFISRLQKKVSYKNGIENAPSAKPSDASTYGIGTIKNEDDSFKDSDLYEFEKDDEGRNLYNNGHLVDIIGYSNVNADIRSLETVSEEEDKLYGGPRTFYGEAGRGVFEDARPDSSGYNTGYTGDVHIITYYRISRSTPALNTDFPNRVLLSEKNETQSYFNSFRDLKGFNFRDYGVELGPIVKIVTVKNVLLSIHPGGVLAIGVDDRTLLSENSDVYIDTAQALSPTAETISDMIGSTHPESIVKTDLTVAGVDYTASAIWVFAGNKLSIVSEFAVKTVLNKFKDDIKALGVDYIPRVYSTFNFSKHLLTFSYVAERKDNKNQTHIGSITYNTVLQKWVSRLSEGNKFIIDLGSDVYSTGFQQADGGISTIWLEDAYDKTKRCNIRGIQYKYHFEFTINEEPALEKILDNIRMITNEVIPYEITYTTSGDENDAADNIWGEPVGERVVEQKIVTRNGSNNFNNPSNNTVQPRSRLGILNQNTYYKNSGLYIEVNKQKTFTRKDANRKRIRDKHIKVKITYKGNDATFIQAIISMLTTSYN